MGIPELIYLTFHLIGLGIALSKNGEPRDGKYDFTISLIVLVIEIFVLKCGGFF